MFTKFKQIIEEAWTNQTLLKKEHYQDIIKETIDLLDKGKIRVAEPTETGWKLNEWVKKAVILYFPIQKMEVTELKPFEFYDKIKLKTSSELVRKKETDFISILESIRNELIDIKRILSQR